MGIRLNFAKRHAPIDRPNVLSSKRPLRFDSIVVSPSLLLKAQVTRDLTRSLVSPNTLDFTREARTTLLHVREIAVSPPIPKTQEHSDALQLPVLISGNLLTPIGKPDRQGKNYAEPKNWEGLFPDRENEATASRRGARKAYTIKKEGSRIVKQVTSIWDMLLPLLKPPLDLDFPTQLDLPSELRHYQVLGVQRLVESTSFLLADEMGTGKTVMSCVALRILFHQARVRHILIVCPATTIPVWDQHLEEWGGEALRCTVVRGSPDTRKIDWGSPAHVYVTSYDTLRNDMLGDSALRTHLRADKFDLVILDEAQAIRNPSAGRSRAVTKIKPRFRWALTGTPLQNKIDDLSAIFRFVKPGLFPSHTPTATQAKELMKPYFLRRRKEDVLADLPEKIRQPIWLELDSGQRQAYEEALGRGRDDFKSGRLSVTRIHIFALISMLRQICNFAPGETTSPKVDLLLDQIDEIVEENKAIVFTQYISEGVEKLRPHLNRYGLVEIHGGTSDPDRKRAIADFQNDPDIRVFLATPGTAGVGITLTEGNYVFHFDQGWNPAIAWQAEDRVHRIGQNKQVNVYCYYMQDTYEVRVEEILREKGLLHEHIINGLSETEFNNSVSIDEWCDVLGLDVTVPKTVTPNESAEASEKSLIDVYEAIAEILPNDFEELVARVFRKIGYPNARVTPQSHDGGIDINASQITAGGKEHIVVQCKRKPQVAAEVARELLGVVSSNPRTAKGFLVVSGKLSSACRAFIETQGSLSYIDGPQLAKHIIDFNIPMP